jgi:hypothetical protein
MFNFIRIRNGIHNENYDLECRKPNFNLNVKFNY